jgi:putative hydrolase of the HAD superfamily
VDIGAVKYLIWDFDGTLGTRINRTWRGVLLEMLDAEVPGHAATEELLRPYLQTGFPWHTPLEPHVEITSSGAWWDRLDPVFERAFAAAGCTPAQAAHLAHRVRLVLPDPTQFRLYDDVLPALDRLSAGGWRHILLSNHVPELRQIVEHLGLMARLSHFFNSAETGYEKPHPQAFRIALDTVGLAEQVWMIGDTMEADIAGAQAAGLPAILVRRFADGAPCYCADLWGIEAVVTAALHV